MKYLLQLVMILFFFQAIIIPQEVQTPDSKIDAYLYSYLQSVSENQFVPVYAVHKDKLTYLDLATRTGFMPKQQKRAEVVRLLKEFSARSMASILIELKNLESEGKVKDIEIIWAINVVVFKALPQVINQLSEQNNKIEKIHYDAKFPYEMLVDDEGITARNDKYNLRVEPTEALQPGLTLINAPAVWAAGDSGQGVLVANIDSGTDWKHPDLVLNIWNNLGEDANGNGKTIIQSGSTWVYDPGDLNGVDNDGNGKVDDLIGWDYEGNDNDPSNGSSHGTATSGQVAGYGTNGTQTGVAPKAHLIILKPSGETQYWSAQQYAIDKGADVVTSSLSYKWYFNPKPNYGLFRQMNDVELAAGVVHTNSTSNDGGSSSAPIPFNISAPGNSPGPWVHPDQTLVGGVSSVIGSANVLASTDVIVSSSPYGPFAWEDLQVNNPSYPYVMPLEYRDYPYQTVSGSMGLIKPDVAAPGNGTTSTAPGGGYQSFSGTSGATPHLAGVAALLLSANPDLTPAQVSMVMQTTAVEKGTPGKDNRYGAGRVDALAAHTLATSGQIPVELTNFKSEVVDGMIYLSWATATEANNLGFEIEKKKFEAPENAYVKIGFVDGNGTTTNETRYQFSDKNVSNGNYVYRLKQIDLDGTFDYVGQTFIIVNIPGQFELSQNYPNPFNPVTSINYTVPEKGFVNLSVYNTLGEKVAELVNEVKEAGSERIEFNASQLTSGTYIYRIAVNGKAISKKLTLLK